FQDQQAEDFTAFPFIPISAVGPFVLPVENFLLAVKNFLLTVGKFLSPVENFLLTDLLKGVLFEHGQFILGLINLIRDLLGTPTEPHHTPSQEAQPSSPTYISTSSIPTVIPIPTVTQYEPTPLRQYTQRARIAQFSALPPVSDEPASLMRDVTPGVTSLVDIEGSMQQTINELIALCTSLQRQHSELLFQFQAQKLETNKLNARVKILEDNQGVIGARSADDAPIKGRRIDEEEGITGRVSSDIEEIRMDKGEVDVERTSEDTEEMATVLTSIDAAIVLAGGIDVPTGSVTIPTAGPRVVDIHTGSDPISTASPIVATTTLVTPYSRRKGKEVMEQEREHKRMTEQIARDAEVARIHAKEELQGMIHSLDRTNETIAKYLQEYQDFASELPLERRIELISELVKYQDNYLKIFKFQSQQRRPWTKKQKKDYYMNVIRNNLGCKVKDIKGMTFEEIEAKFAAVWKLVEDFIPMGSKEEAKRLKRKGFNLEQEKAKKQKTSKEVPDKEKSLEEILEEKVKEMMQLVPIEEVIRSALSDKEMELWVELKRLYEPDPKDQLWAQTQNYMHAPIEWKLYDLSGVHHVTAKDKEIFILVEKDYPLRKGLALVMICYKLQVENYSQMAEDLIRKIYNIANSPRQQGDDKLPVIISKDLSVEEKTALITVLKSHKRAIAWKLSDIKARKPLTFSGLATIDPPGDIMAQTTQPRRVRFRKEIRCHKTPSKFTKFLTSGEKTNRLHDSKIKDRVFNIGDRVLIFNSRLKIFSGKLKSCWSGPFTISHVFPYGTVELSQPDGPNFKVNGHRLKHYFGEDVPKMVFPDLQTFLKDQ
nr:reverse transcriptase domain-containing protein [Tanacetum cinerariifolium]